jgi:hypothetical protein
LENLIFLGLAAAVLLAAVASLPSRPQPPQIIYLQTTPTEPGGSGCLPLLLLVGVIVAALGRIRKLGLYR